MTQDNSHIAVRAAAASARNTPAFWTCRRRQAQRFDPSGAYIRHWVTELADVPTALLHDPPADVRRRCGYPLPIVEHHEAVAIFRARRAS